MGESTAFFWRAMLWLLANAFIAGMAMWGTLSLFKRSQRRFVAAVAALDGAIVVRGIPIASQQGFDFAGNRWMLACALVVVSLNTLMAFYEPGSPLLWSGVYMLPWMVPFTALSKWRGVVLAVDRDGFHSCGHVSATNATGLIPWHTIERHWWKRWAEGTWTLGFIARKGTPPNTLGYSVELHGLEVDEEGRKTIDEYIRENARVPRPTAA